MALGDGASLDDVEDFAQEGWVAIWRELPHCTDSSWLATVALNRMRNIIREGKAAKRGRDYRTISVDDVTRYWDDETTMRALELAYHHGEIADAISRLPKDQRSYVIRKFWFDWSPESLDIYFANAKSTWRCARKRLQNDLCHLRSSDDSLCPTA